MREAFTNNAVGAIASAISASDTELILGDTPGAARFYDSHQDGEIQRATIFGADPDVFEIVHITGKIGTTLWVTRGQEGTDAASWPAGASVSARVTAEMLYALADGPIERREGVVLDSSYFFDGTSETMTYGGAVTGARGTLVFNGRSVLADTVQLSGYPVLQLENAAIAEKYDASKQDKNLSFPSVGGTFRVDLGVPRTWTANTTVWRGTVMAPTTPNGFQYWVEIDRPGWPDVQTELTEPDWGAIDPNTNAVEGANMRWRPVATPIEFIQEFAHGLVVTEVGFIAGEVLATTMPSVSIGTSSDPDRYASNVALTQINGGYRIHRIPVTDNVINYDLSFKLESAATGGACPGRFYWRGFFVQL